jgi:hypothetical protein
MPGTKNIHLFGYNKKTIIAAAVKCFCERAGAAACSSNNCLLEIVPTKIITN